MTVDSFLVTFAGIYIVFWALYLLIGLASYLLRGFGMYTLAKKQDVMHPWLSFIPYGRTWLQGELSGDLTFKKKTMKNPGIWMIVLPFIYGAVFTVIYMIVWFGTMFSMMETFGHMSSASGYEMTRQLENAFANGNLGGKIIGLVFGFVVMILVAVIFKVITKTLRALVDRQIYNKYTTTNMSVLHAVCSVLLPLYESICLFVYSRKTAKMMTPAYNEMPEITPASANPVESEQTTQSTTETINYEPED